MACKCKCSWVFSVPYPQGALRDCTFTPQIYLVCSFIYFLNSPGRIQSELYYGAQDFHSTSILHQICYHVVAVRGLPGGIKVHNAHTSRRSWVVSHLGVCGYRSPDLSAWRRLRYQLRYNTTESKKRHNFIKNENCKIANAQLLSSYVGFS